MEVVYISKKEEFYVYEWYNKNTGEVFYVGKGSKNRYKSIKNRNQYFNNYYNKYSCDVRKVKTNLKEDEAFALEKELIKKYRKISQAKCNISDGGEGSTFPEGSWHDYYSKLKTLYYLRGAMDEMINEEEYDPKTLKTKSLEELKKLYDDYYKYEEFREYYFEFRKECEPFNSLPKDYDQLTPFEIEVQNIEITMLTDIVFKNIIHQNSEFSNLMNYKGEIDYMYKDVDIDKLLNLMLEDINYHIHLIESIIVNLWALKRIGKDPFANFHTKVKSFNIKDDGYVRIKFKKDGVKGEMRIKIHIHDLMWGLLVFKDTTLLQIIYNELLLAPIID